MPHYSIEGRCLVDSSHIFGVFEEMKECGERKSLSLVIMNHICF